MKKNLYKNQKGFSAAFIFLIFIILFIVLVIVPGYLRIHYRAQQITTRGNLEAMRKALDLYHLRTGYYPAYLGELVPNYMYPFPEVKLGIAGYPSTRGVTRVMMDSGMWYYNPETGNLRVDAFSLDSEQDIISTW